MSTAGILRTLLNWGGGVWCLDQGKLLPLHTDDQVHAYLNADAVAIGDADDSYFVAAGGQIATGMTVATGVTVYSGYKAHPSPNEALCDLVRTAAAARPVATIK